MITKKNYKSYFLDYHEGNMGETQRKEVVAFLEQNPDLQEEFESFENVKIEPSQELKYTRKDVLKKNTIGIHNYKTWFVAYHERDLSETERNDVEHFLEANPSLGLEFKMFSQSRILPDQIIIFKNKNSLKRGGKVIMFSTNLYRTVAVAASLILLLLSYYIFRVEHKEKSMMADQKQVPAIQMPLIPISKKDSSNHGASQKEMNKDEKKKYNRPIRSAQTPAFASVQRKEKQVPIIPVIEKTTKNVLPEQPVAERPAQFQKQDNPSLPAVDPVITVQLNKTNKIEDSGNIQLSDIFTTEELKELGMSDKSAQQEKKSSLWNLAETGAEKLSKATGTKMTVDKQHDAMNDANTYSLAIGGFSISHSSVK